MSALRPLIDDAVAAVIAEHPKYFTPKGMEKARPAMVRKILAAFRDGGDKPVDEPAPITDTEPFVFVEPASREARGYATLRSIGGAVPPKLINDRIAIPRAAYRADVFALADLPPVEQWPFLTEHKRIAAWTEFFRKTLPDGARRSITQNRDGATGILMPGYWPPSKDGRMYDSPGLA